VIIPKLEAGEIAVTLIFSADPKTWSEDDRAAIIRRLKQFFRKSCGPKRRRRKVMKNAKNS
jgi:hypothetical protein